VVTLESRERREREGEREREEGKEVQYTVYKWFLTNKCSNKIKPPCTCV